MGCTPAAVNRTQDLAYRNKISEAYAQNAVSERIKRIEKEQQEETNGGPEDMFSSFGAFFYF